MIRAVVEHLKKNSLQDKTLRINAYMKNCDPFVFGPLFAMDNKYGLSCFKLKSSSERLQVQSLIKQRDLIQKGHDRAK